MANPQPIEDRATLYVLGELPAVELRQFETELAAAPDLQNAVRELEEGVLALSASAPTHVAPQFVLNRIEDAVEAETRSSKILPMFTRLICNGWAAAAACLLGWILYALAIDRPEQTPSNQKLIVQNDPVSPGIGKIASTIPTNVVVVEAPPGNRETIILSNQIVGLQRQVLQLSQSVTQQQALLNDASRIKFHQLVPANTTQPWSARSLSPALQWALFLAMARELGWIASTNEAANPKGNETFNVEFVDFRPEKDKANSATQETEKQAEAQPKPKEFALATTEEPVAAVIPAFVSGENLVVAVDSSIAARGSHVAVVSRGTGEVFGTVTIGENAVVFTVPNNVQGGLVFLTTSPNGQTSLYDIGVASPP